MAYTMLKEDFNRLNEEFPNSQERTRTRYQIDHYPTPSRGKAIIHEQYGRATKSTRPPLVLAAEDGYDGEPVGSLAGDSAQCFWDTVAFHIFPPMVDLVRLSFFFHLNLYQTALLVLRGEGEEYIARKRGYRCGLGFTFREFVQPPFTNEEFGGFRPDIKAIYSAISSHFEMVRRRHEETPSDEQVSQEYDRLVKMGYEKHDEESFEFIVREMLLNRVYLHGIFSETAKLVIKQVADDIGSNSLEFQIAKAQWIGLQERLGELLLALDRRWLDNGHIRQQFLTQCEYYHEFEEQRLREERLDHRVLLKKTDRDLTWEELEEKLKEREIQDARKLSDLRSIEVMGRWIWQPDGEPDPPDRTIGEEELTRYRREIRDILTRIYLLLHPDRLTFHSAYARMTDAQKEAIRELWHRTMDIRPEDLRFQPGQVGYILRSKERLQEIRSMVEKIFEHAGFDIDVRLIIEGSTLKEKQKWLEMQIAQLEKDINTVTDEIAALGQDEEVRMMWSFLSTTQEKQESARSEMQRRTEETRQRCEKLEQELEELFASQERK